MAARRFLFVEDASCTGGVGCATDLSQERSLVLQTELLLAYRSETFQQKLGKLWTRAFEQRVIRAHQVHSFLKKLIRRTQASVFINHSFQATDEGVEALAIALERYPDGPDAPALVEIMTDILDKVQIFEASAAIAEKSHGGVFCPCLNRREQVDETVALHLTRETAEDLLSQLQQAFNSKRFHKLCVVVTDKYDCLLIPQPGKLPTVFRAWLPERMSQTLLITYAEILARFGFDQGEKGVGQMWWALRPFFDDPAIMGKATAVIQSLGVAMQQAWESVQPYQALVVQAGCSQPLLSKKRAMAMHLELMGRFSTPSFQVSLNALHRNHHPCSAAFGRCLADLLAPIYASVLPSYGFASTEEGLMVMTLATGRLLGEPDLETLAVSIDGLLYGAEPDIWEVRARVGGRRRMLYHVKPDSSEDQASQEAEDQALEDQAWDRLLGKQQVLLLLREHLAAFSTSDFQQKVAVLRSEAVREGYPGKETRDMMVARVRLALTAQLSFLPKFGLEGSLRGAHSMLHLCIPYIFDPEVARLTYAVHFLLGMDEPGALVAKMRRIQGEVDLPSI